MYIQSGASCGCKHYYQCKLLLPTLKAASPILAPGAFSWLFLTGQRPQTWTYRTIANPPNVYTGLLSNVALLTRWPFRLARCILKVKHSPYVDLLIPSFIIAILWAFACNTLILIDSRANQPPSPLLAGRGLEHQHQLTSDSICPCSLP